VWSTDRSCVLSIVFINEGPPDRWSLIRLTDGPWSDIRPYYTIIYLSMDSYIRATCGFHIPLALVSYFIHHLDIADKGRENTNVTLLLHFSIPHNTFSHLIHGFSSFLHRIVKSSKQVLAQPLQPPFYCCCVAPNRFIIFCGCREIRQKVNLAERTGTWLGLSRRTTTNATKGVSAVCEPLPPDRPLWFPGSSPPEWLDGRFVYKSF